VSARAALALAGLVAGVVTALGPVGPASAYCDPDTGAGDPGCSNSCYETGERYEAVRAKVEGHGGIHLPSYWDLFLCPEYQP
jgi:hypothetical protein